MAISVVMPRLSDTMEEGKSLRWRKKEGERVEGGEIIAEVQTDKADIEMEAFGSGILQKILVGAGQSAPVGHPIGVIAEADEDISVLLSPAISSATQAETPLQAGASALPVAPAPRAVTAGRVKASPLARRLARAQGVELAVVKGTGPGGRVVRRDVEAVTSAGTAAGQRAPFIAPTPLTAEPRSARAPARSRARRHRRRDHLSQSRPADVDLAR